jgi:hypothetical protein
MAMTDIPLQPVFPIRQRQICGGGYIDESFGRGHMGCLQLRNMNASMKGY